MLSVSTLLYIKMNSLTCYVLLVMCCGCTIAQLTQNAFDPTRQLSLQQQSNILSDIQQHQRRFNLPVSSQNQQPFFGSQSNVFNQPNSQQRLQQSNLLAQQQQFGQQVRFPQQLGQQFPTQQSQFQNHQLSNQQLYQQQQLLQNTFNPVLPTSGPAIVPSLQNTAAVLTTVPTYTQQNIDNNRLLQQQQQHHTQTNFQSNFGQQNVQNPFPSPQSVRPTDFVPQTTTEDPEKRQQRLQELKEKQAIIDKHNQFVEKQYEKALKKAQNEHLEFVKKQNDQKKKLFQRLYKPGQQQQRINPYSQVSPRYIYPEEASLFEKAVKQYYIEHPTTTTTTTTTTTEAPSTTTEEEPTTTITKTSKQTFLPTVLPTSKTQIQSLDDLNFLQKQYKNQKINKDDLLAQLRLAIGNTEDDVSKNLSSREISLANGQKVQLIQTDDPKKIPRGKSQEITLPNGQKAEIYAANSNIEADATQEITLPDGKKVQLIKSSDDRIPGDIKADEITLPSGQRIQVIKNLSGNQDGLKMQEITLPNGEKVELIRTTDPKLVPGATPLEAGSDLEKLVFSRTTTNKPPKEIIDELTKGVVPDGSNYQLLKTGASGGLEQLPTGPQDLPDKKKVTFVLLEEGPDGTLKVQGVKGNGKEKPDVDSILKRIKSGEIKLPSTTPKTPSSASVPSSTLAYGTKITPQNKKFSGPISVTVSPNSFASSEDDSASELSLNSNIGTQFVSTTASNIISRYTTQEPSRKTSYYSTTKKPTRSPHILNHQSSTGTSNDLVRASSTLSIPSTQSSVNIRPNSISTTVEFIKSTTASGVLSSTPDYGTIDKSDTYHELADVLKRNGLFAMAKYLKQSGLDTILNETGPYTIFAPNDKAFRTLLVQLGGPEKAEEKFKENPRLLSGLLLHHVIPGAFNIDALQDEMTGVSLAGTQLRVNQYEMHDVEWNDVKVTTINGAKIMDDKKDLIIPQGVAHAVDKVMFPLPVGDIVQTLQSDREKRFTNFLRALFASGLADTLQGTKTFTLFAPTDKAFAGLSSEDLNKMVTDRTLARELVLSHLAQGTLYTNGIRYYQVRDSLQQEKSFTFTKQSGKVKINNSSLSTPNIPATNGVIHGIDSLL